MASDSSEQVRDQTKRVEPLVKSPPIFSAQRVWVLMASTFTQLVRMKTFYFLAIFALLVIAASNLNLLYTPVQQLKVIRETSLGAMSIFSWLFAITATAVLIPRDLEDRTLYTILCKPVPRLEYLVGKLLGVLAVIGVALALMCGLFTVILHFQETSIIASEMHHMAQNPRFTEEDRITEAAMIAAYGPDLNLLYGVLAVFLKSAVLAAVAMLVSTFASSSLFTIIITFVVFLIGHFHKMATDFWVVEQQGGWITRMIGKVMILVIPDFQIFNISDSISSGQVVGLATMVEMSGLAALYLGLFTIASWFVFSDKEF
ncbi:MAG: hypothetical protein L3J39_04715 [Verrucomicrobiales bacterium]|nr:hypothetical protein [Verrucomicrobiales bacterium]